MGMTPSFLSVAACWSFDTERILILIALLRWAETAFELCISVAAHWPPASIKAISSVCRDSNVK
eukprot:2916108-Rhodomonas_salina.5